MPRDKFTMPSDAKGWSPNGIVWTGETQAFSFTATPTTATKITVPGKWYRFYATAICHINIGNGAGIQPASSSLEDACFPVQSGVITDPVYIPGNFDSAGDGTGDNYLSVVRNAADGTLYVIQAFSDESTRTYAASSTTTTTTTTTT